MRDVPLGEAVEFIRGVTFKPEQLVDPFANGSVVCMRTKNIQSDLDASDLIAVPRELVGSDRKLLRGGDLLLSSANSWDLVGKAVFVPELSYPATAGGFISIVRPRKGTYPRFLYHWVTQPAVQHIIRQCGRQTTNISNLDVNRFLSLDFPYPDEDEQRRIAAILDKADGIRRKRRQVVAEINALLRATFLDMFGDPGTNPFGFPVRSVEEGLSRMRPGTQSGPFGSALKKHEYVPDGVPVWGIDNVQGGRFVPEALLFITTEKFEQLERYSVRSRDILISRAGTVGRMCIADPPVPRSIISTNLVRVVLDEAQLTPEYFVTLFAIFPDRLARLKSNKKDNAFTFLNPGTLKAMEIPFPPPDRQLAFRTNMDALQAHRRLHDCGALRADELFASLSQRAFRGEL